MADSIDILIPASLVRTAGRALRSGGAVLADTGDPAFPVRATMPLGHVVGGVYGLQARIHRRYGACLTFPVAMVGTMATTAPGLPFLTPCDRDDCLEFGSGGPGHGGGRDSHL